MAKQNYEESLKRLLRHEGGYTNHPSDPGGPTNFGITIYDYRKYVKPDAVASDVKAMRLDEAKSIYRAKYWDAQKCDDLPSGVDYSIFDYGVNSGIGRSGKVLRRVVGLPSDTHVVNDAVIKAVQSRDAKELVESINAERLAFLKRLKTWPVFGTGWGRRVTEVRAISLRMLSEKPTDLAPQDTAPRPDLDPDDVAPKGMPEPVEPKPLTKSKTMWGNTVQWLSGGFATFMAALAGVPWQVWVVLAVLIAIGAFLVYKGRIDVQKVVQHLSQGDAANEAG